MVLVEQKISRSNRIILIDRTTLNIMRENLDVRSCVGIVAVLDAESADSGDVSIASASSRLLPHSGPTPTLSSRTPILYSSLLRVLILSVSLYNYLCSSLGVDYAVIGGISTHE